VREDWWALLVRRVYAQLLGWAARQGRARRTAETPLEFAAALDGLRPDLRDDVDAITRAYLMLWYGELPESADRTGAVLASWDRVRRGFGRLEARVRGTLGKARGCT
jgi:hypothetical protein